MQFLINRLIDHTLLKPYATEKEVIKLCEEAKKYNFFSVCVFPIYVSLCKKLLKDTNIKVTTVISFPFGASTVATKCFETKEAIKNGADEIDMVMNITAFKSKNYKFVLDEIKSVREITKGKILKIIIETAYLTKEEKIKAAQIVKEAEADFIKTSTGFTSTGATVKDVKIIKSVVGNHLGIKAAGGIRSLKEAIALINAGATRIGTSASLDIIKQLYN